MKKNHDFSPEQSVSRINRALPFLILLIFAFLLLNFFEGAFTPFVLRLAPSSPTVHLLIFRNKEEFLAEAVQFQETPHYSLVFEEENALFLSDGPLPQDSSLYWLTDQFDLQQLFPDSQNTSVSITRWSQHRMNEDAFQQWICELQEKEYPLAARSRLPWIRSWKWIWPARRVSWQTIWVIDYTDNVQDPLILQKK